MIFGSHQEAAKNKDWSDNQESRPCRILNFVRRVLRCRRNPPGLVAAVWYHGHNISHEFDKLTHGFVKSATAYAGFYGLSGSGVKATGRVPRFSVLGRRAIFSSHVAGIGKFARSAPGLPIMPELLHPLRRGPMRVILGYPLAYVWNRSHAAARAGMGHPAHLGS